MNPYLTEKSARPRAWRTATAAICLFFAVISLTTIVNFVQQGDWGTAGAGVLILALLLWPAWRNLRYVAQGREARLVARHLVSRAEERIPLASLARDVGRPRLTNDLNRLIEDGFLRNIRIDGQARDVVLTAPATGPALTEVECPGCGAKNPVVPGRVGRCAYCGHPLISERTDGRRMP